MWTLKESAEGAGKSENARKIKEGLEALTGCIEEIRHIEVGLNLPFFKDNGDVVLIAKFDDAEALKRYAQHPEHRKMVDFIGKVTIERHAVDYEG
jgi:quinol monooxygenase YgiN